ncbi:MULTISPECIES: hypothetical protein [unclassified Flavobacterium]|uniref:hypothetical protein n=1 Tax=unclassified Flavobacterium TaxID=196869 RepID=UPI003F91BC28
MKKLILLSLFFSVSAFCQVNDAVLNIFSLESTTIDVKVLIAGKTNSDQIQGSKYLFPSWTDKFIVHMSKGEVYQLSNLNYNILTKKIESFVSTDSIYQYDLKQFDYLICGGKRYKVVNSDIISGLLLEIYNGKKLKLFNEVGLVVQPGSYNPIMPSQNSKDRYVKIDSYYLYINENYEKIKLNKKDVLNSLGDNEKAIKEYVKNNNLKFSSIDDIKQIFSYYESL